MRRAPRSMASAEDDLATDSVPDAPRAHPPSEDDDDDGGDGGGGGDDCRRSGSNSGSADEPEGAEGKPRSSKKKAPPRDERRRSSSSKQRNSFGIPQLNSPGGGGTMVCISNATNVHVGNSISINFVGQAYSQPNSSKTPSPEPRNTQKPKDIKDACKSTAPVTLEHLDAVTEHIGKRWMKLGERLGYTDEQMERFHEDHNDMGLKEVVYQMLLDWKQFKGPLAQVGILCHCLWGARLYAAAEHLAALTPGKAP